MECLVLRLQQEMDTSTASAKDTIIFQFGPVSEEPVVSIDGDLTGLEFTNSTVDGSDHQVALNNVTFSIADAGAVVSAKAQIIVKAADGVSRIENVSIDATSNAIPAGVTVGNKTTNFE